jgi:hypothetical protein
VRRTAKKNAPRGRVYMVLVAPQGFEPRYAAPEAAVLPLNEGAITRHPDAHSGILHFSNHKVSPVYGQTDAGCLRLFGRPGVYSEPCHGTRSQFACGNNSIENTGCAAVRTALHEMLRLRGRALPLFFRRHSFLLCLLFSIPVFAQTTPVCHVRSLAPSLPACFPDGIKVEDFHSLTIDGLAARQAQSGAGAAIFLRGSLDHQLPGFAGDKDVSQPR